MELEHASSCYALHDSFLCWDRTPCVVFSEGCSSENIVYILVHESIHHALLWINGEGCRYKEPPEHIVELMEDDGIVLEELLV